MKIVLLILLTSCALLKAEYPRHKIRGPPHPPRIHPSKQFAKKWHQQSQYPPRNPVRSRPIPVHMPPAHKIPMGMPQAPPRAVAPPVRTFWKNTQSSTKFQSEKQYLPRQEKPFLAAPSISAQEFDYHIQTNSIPTTHTNPIKQVGEKGPIHTIPAPNLSLRDKPIVVEEVRYQHPHTSPYVKVEPTHQYQVTEQPELPPNQKLLYTAPQQLQQIHQQQLQSQQQQQLQSQQQHLQLQQHLLQQELQKQIEVQPQQLFYTTDPISLSQTLPLPTQKVNQGEIYLNSQLNPKELYQIIGAAYPQLQTQVQSQDVQQAFYQPQQASNYQALLSQQLFQPEQKFTQHSQPAEVTQVSTDKAKFQPELHSFNYDEQTHRKTQQGLSKKELSSLVSAAYNLDSNVAGSEPIAARNSLDPLAQAQLIQNYFESRSDVVENGVEPDAKPSENQRNQPEKIKEELLGSSYYSSLPNKEAADRLADLQSAGKINSNLMKISSGGQQSKDDMTIFVPDESNAEEDNGKGEDTDSYPDSSKEQLLEYDDYSQEEGDILEDKDESVGHRMQQKNK